MTPNPDANSSTPASQTGSEPHVDRGRRDHYAILLDAEVGRLVHELRPFGVLSEHELERRADAALWHSGTFQAALRAGERRGRLERLPCGFVSLPRHHDERRDPPRTGLLRRVSCELCGICRRARERSASRPQTPTGPLPPAGDWW